MWLKQRDVSFRWIYKNLKTNPLIPEARVKIYTICAVLLSFWVAYSNYL
jgi:hypothetical protein